MHFGQMQVKSQTTCLHRRVVLFLEKYGTIDVMLKNFYNRLSIGKDLYHTYKKEIHLAKNISIRDKPLMQELEKVCKNNFGVLTYAEYTAIEQFGDNGFYATSDLHGKTDIDDRWGMALATYCQKNSLERIIEVGCGSGELGIETVIAYEKLTNKHLKWTGIEIDKRIHENIKVLFTTYSVQESIEQIATTLDEVSVKPNTLIVFPYSLDNIPPHVFLNTTEKRMYPDALLGMTMNNGKLSEIIIPQEILQKKGITLSNGMFTQNNITYKLTTWKLRKGQRAYIATDVYTMLYQYAKKFGGSAHLIIIDEFRDASLAISWENLGTPKSLYERNLVMNDRIRYYRESGMHNSYFPVYKDSLLQFLNTIGFQSITYDIEQKVAAQLSNKKWLPIRKKYTTFAFLAHTLVRKNHAILSIPFAQKKIW